ncbi:putative nuclease HARBI1 [Anopheles coustani]|nr:putative nuclease HARBI1 [Anopheles coustani]
MDNLLMSEEWPTTLSRVIELSTQNSQQRNRQRNRRIVRRWWMRPIFFRRQEDGNRLLDNIVAEQANETMINFLRMKKEDFDVLLDMIRPEINRMNTNMRDSITAQERLLITLRYLATGETFSSLQYLFRVSRSSISNIVKETCSCLTKALRDFVKLPNCPDEWLKVAQGFQEKFNFPHVLGAIDGKHVAIKAPHHSGTDYFNYKKIFK